MALTPEQIEDRLNALEAKNTKLEQRLRSGQNRTGDPLGLATDLDDLGSVKTFLEIEEPTLTPGTPFANVVRLYAKDNAGVPALYYKGDDGAEVGPLS